MTGQNRLRPIAYYHQTQMRALIVDYNSLQCWWERYIWVLKLVTTSRCWWQNLKSVLFCTLMIFQDHHHHLIITWLSNKGWDLSFRTYRFGALYIWPVRESLYFDRSMDPNILTGPWSPIYLIGPWIPIFLTGPWIQIFWPVRGSLYFWSVRGSLYF